VASAVSQAGGFEAMQLRLAESYVSQFGNLARTNNTMIVPANISDLATMVATSMKIIQKTSSDTTALNNPKPPVITR
jgi:hypothetical protein